MKQLAGDVVALTPDEAELVYEWYCQVSDDIKSVTPNWRSELKNRPKWIAIQDALKRLKSGGLKLTWEQWSYYYAAHLGHPNIQKFEFQ